MKMTNKIWVGGLFIALITTLAISGYDSSIYSQKNGLFPIPIRFNTFTVEPGLNTEKNPPSSSQIIKTALNSSLAKKNRAVNNFNNLPLRFEANRGQSNEPVRYLSRGRGYGMYFAPEETILILKSNGEGETATIRMSLIDANPDLEVLGKNQIVTKTNYLIGNDPSKWRSNVPNYSKVLYKDAYPGIDLVYYGNSNSLEYDFIVFPGADPKVIEMEFDGAQSLELDSEGNLVLKTSNGKVIQHAPKIYQQINDKKTKVTGNFLLLGDNRVGYEVAEYDHNVPLIIDPLLEFSTYLSGSSADNCHGIAVDAEGDIYIACATESMDFSTVNPIQTSAQVSSRSAHVTKLNASGTQILFSTFLGGTSYDTVFGIAVDEQENVFISGYTRSLDFPTLNPFQANLNGTSDVFVSKLDSQGSTLLYSTYFGGSSFEQIIFLGGIDIDAEGNAYVVANTNSSDIPLANATQQTFGGVNDAFVFKLDPMGNTLLFSTYLGGVGRDRPKDIAVDSEGKVYVVGQTESIDFPIINAFQSQASEGFITKLDPSAGTILYSTFFGGVVEGVSVDSNNNLFVTGTTTSEDFPTKNAFQNQLKNSSDAFISKLDSAGSTLLYSTYLGGSSIDLGKKITVDSEGNAYFVGVTKSDDFPTQDPLLNTTGSLNNVFVGKLDASGGNLLFSTLMGGTEDDFARSIAIGPDKNIYITGETQSINFPLKNPIMLNKDSSEGFVSKIDLRKNELTIDVTGLPIEIISPYWQANAESFSFISIAHPSLSGMNTQIGVIMQAVLGDVDDSRIFQAQGNSDATGRVQFTINANDIQKVFIVGTNHFFFQPENVPDRVELLLVGTPSPVSGQLLFYNPLANPNTCATSVENHCGFLDLSQLSIWGAVIVQHTNTGFAMQFIGDNQDSRAVSQPIFSGIN